MNIIKKVCLGGVAVLSMCLLGGCATEPKDTPSTFTVHMWSPCPEARDGVLTFSEGSHAMPRQRLERLGQALNEDAEIRSRIAAWVEKE